MSAPPRANIQGWNGAATWLTGGQMDPDQENQLNQSAYRQLQGLIARTYPPGRFVAISGGRIVADAETFE